MKNDYTIYNLDKIVKIYVAEKNINNKYVYLEDRYILFGYYKIQDSGIYYDSYRGYEKKDIPNDCYSEDNVVYYKPYCYVYFVDGSNKEFRFQTINELNEFVDSIKEKTNNILIK